VKVEHIGIAVEDLDAAEATFSKILNQKPYKREKVESEHVEVCFFMVGETKIELLSATSGESAIAKFIEKKGPGIHHLAFGTGSIESETDRLMGEGFSMINSKEKAGADGMLINFLHPKLTEKVLIEICQPIWGPDRD
jgi:methylmalonyl-CoA/ethylmalonyl-CoA epimerase